MRETFSLDPGSSTSYYGLVGAYLQLNRLQEVRATAGEAQAKNLDFPGLRRFLYLLAFLQNDAAGMAQQVALAAGKPGVEDVLLANEADTAAYSGRLSKAREGALLRLCRLGSKFQEVLQITKLLTVFEVYDTEAAAVASFSN